MIWVQPGILGCLGRFDRKNGGGQMKKGAATGSISQNETRFLLSPAVDSSQPTYSRKNHKYPNKQYQTNEVQIQILPVDCAIVSFSTL